MLNEHAIMMNPDDSCEVPLHWPNVFSMELHLTQEEEHQLCQEIIRLEMFSLSPWELQESFRHIYKRNHQEFWT